MLFLMIRRPPRVTQGRSSAASDVYKRQYPDCVVLICASGDLVQGERVHLGRRGFGRWLGAGVHQWQKVGQGGRGAGRGRRLPGQGVEAAAVVADRLPAIVDRVTLVADPLRATGCSDSASDKIAVSYTHLTLATTYSV